MKLIHTSDWHLGQPLYGYDRSEEQEDMLRQIEDMVRVHQPDALLVSGDVFHSPQTTAQAQRMFSDAITRIHYACESMRIVITSGNHDSSARHEVFRSPWQRLNVDVVGYFDSTDLSRHIIKLDNKGYVIAFPYANERTLSKECFQCALDMVAKLNTENLPIVMMAHTTIKGCDFAGHAELPDLSIGGIDALAASDVGSGYDYLALGHIHKPQRVHGGSGYTRYCGSPIAVNFGEAYPHGVSLVEIGCHSGTVAVEELEICSTKPLATLPTTGAATLEECKELVRNFPAESSAYVRVNLLIESYIPDYAENELRALTEDKKCTFCGINPVRSEKAAATTEPEALTVQEFQAKSPLEIVRMHAASIDMELDEDMEKMFSEAETMVKHDLDKEGSR